MELPEEGCDTRLMERPGQSTRDMVHGTRDVIHGMGHVT